MELTPRSSMPMDSLTSLFRCIATCIAPRPSRLASGSRSASDLERRPWLVFERLIGKRSLYASAPRFLQIAITFVLVMFGWVFFRCENIGEAFQYIATMFGADSGATRALALRPIHALAAVGGALVLWGFPTTQQLIYKARVSWVLPLQLAFWIALLHLHYVSHVPFLYYQF